MSFVCGVHGGGVALSWGSACTCARAISVDGSLADWCFPSATLGVNTRSTLTSLTVPCTGSEVVWTDFVGDGRGVAIYGGDIRTFATTANSTHLYFALQYDFLGLQTQNIQIAIDVPGISPSIPSWVDPATLWFSGGPYAPAAILCCTAGTSANTTVAPNYVLSIYAGGISAPTGYVILPSTVDGGYWSTGDTGDFAPLTTPTVAKTTLGSTISMEVSVPWSSLGLGGPPGAGSPIYLSVMTANGTTISPAGPTLAVPAVSTPTLTNDIEDVLSEALAGTYTTTADSCSTLEFGSICELSITDSKSADAFIAVSYDSTTAIRLRGLQAEKANTGMVQ